MCRSNRAISRLTRLCVSDLRQMVRVSLPLILQSSRQKKNKLRYTFDVAWQHHVLIDVYVWDKSCLTNEWVMSSVTRSIKVTLYRVRRQPCAKSPATKCAVQSHMSGKLCYSREWLSVMQDMAHPCETWWCTFDTVLTLHIESCHTCGVSTLAGWSCCGP